MDLEGVSVRSGSGDDQESKETLDKHTLLNEIEVGIIGGSGSPERVGFERVEEEFRCDGSKVVTDIGAADKSGRYGENKVGTNGSYSGEDGVFVFLEQGKMQNGEPIPSFDGIQVGGVPVVTGIEELDSSEPAEIESIKSYDFEESRIRTNGSRVDEVGDLGNKFSVEDRISVGMNNKGNAIDGVVETPLNGIGSPSARLEEAVASAENGLPRSKKWEEKVGVLGTVSPFSDIVVEINGSSVKDTGDLGGDEHARDYITEKSNENGRKTEEVAETPSNSIGSPPGSAGGGSTSKGYGLKKWKRIRRNALKDGNSGGDLNRILKRGPPNAMDPVKMKETMGDNKHKSKSSVSSMIQMVENMEFSSLPLGVSNSESRSAVGSAFTAATDSENSEDQSSKSSTAASTVKSRQEMPIVIGFTKEKNKLKNPNSKISSNSTPSGQRGKSKVESSKKLRRGRIKSNKESSYSSCESDLRSSGSVFLPVGIVGVSNEIERDRSLNYGLDSSVEAQVCEPHSSEEVRIDYDEENGEEVDNVLRENSTSHESREKKKENMNSGLLPDDDPLLESIVSLQAAQEALEQEIEKFREIRINPIEAPDDSSHDFTFSSKFHLVETRIATPESASQVHFGEMEESSFPPADTQLSKLICQTNLLEHLLEETKEILKAKESKVLELESTLSSARFLGKESDNNLQSLQELYHKIEIEFEDIFMKKTAAEIEYLALIRTTQKQRVPLKDQIALLEEQKYLAEEQTHMVLKLKDEEQKANLLKGRAEKLEASSRELLRTVEVLEIQNNMYKHALFSFIQVVLCCVVLGWFLLQLFPSSKGDFPT